MKQNKLPLRNEINADLKWKIEDLYATDEAWKKDYEKLKKSLIKILSFKGNLEDSAKTVLECLKCKDKLSQLAEKVYVYANMKSHEDTSNSHYQALADQAQNIMVQFSTASSFIVPEILSVDEEILNKFINSNRGLKKYSQYLLNLIRNRSYILSSEVEKIFAQMGEITDSPDNIFSMLNNADIQFPEIKNEQGEYIELTKSRYAIFLESKDIRVRRDAFKALYETYAKQKNTLAAIFSASIKKDSFLANVRGYSSALAMSLHKNKIPLDVYTNLIDTVHKNLHLMHKYVALRKKFLGLDELHMYDLYVPMIKDVEMEIPFEEAKQIVVEGLQPMGEEYISLLKKGYEEGWIDVAESQGKRSGAYSWGAYGTHPYVLLNYQDNLDNVFTLAHEMGHSLHSYYSDDTQPYIYTGYKLFVAEVASAVNESLLMEHMLKTTDDKSQKAYLINYFLGQFKGTFFRQTMFAEFEMITHELVENGESLTVDTLCSIYHNLNKQYFGDDIIIDKEIDMEWARIPHFYEAFYVYQYATGFSAAIALSQKILKEGKPTVEDYISFLKSGSSDYPINLLKKAGVDMTTAQPIEEALKVFGNLLEQIDELLS